MRIIYYLTIILIVLSGNTATAQLARDFINLDTNKVIPYIFLGDTGTVQYKGSFMHETDTIYKYHYVFGNRDYDLVVGANGDELVLYHYIFDGSLYEDDPYAEQIKIVDNDQVLKDRIRQAADMGVDSFEVTTRYLPSIKLGELKFQDVIEYEMHHFFVYSPFSGDKWVDGYYTIYIAKGYGVIARKSDEKYEAIMLGK